MNPIWTRPITGSVVAVGTLAFLFDEEDPRSAAEQVDAKYLIRWRPFPGFTFDPETTTISYPGDPDLRPAAEARLRDERLFLYPGDWLGILSPDGKFEISWLR